MDVRAFFDAVAEKWDQIAIHDREKIKHIVDYAKIKSSDLIIDLGCGTGVLLAEIGKYVNNDKSIKAIDLSANMIEIARKKNGEGKIEYICCDFYDYQITNKVDVIIAYSCFPHFQDQSSFFLKCNEALMDNGKLLIAHSESRVSINKAHSAIEIKSAILEKAEDIVTLAMKFGFYEIDKVDNEEMYLVLLGKEES